MSFTAQLAKSGSTPIHFVTCKDELGRDCFYFVMATFEQMKMLAKVTSGIFDVTKFGKIIASGFGKNPSPRLKDELKERFNVDFDALK